MLRLTISLCFTIILFALPNQSCAASDWISAPRPSFPSSSLRKGSEGAVKLRVVVAKDGNVTEATISKSSGDAVLDETARRAVLEWKMKTSAIKPADLAKGREEIIEFRQEAPLVARHPDRVAFFQGKGGMVGETELSKLWMFAPFPSYPLEARRHYQEGVAWIALTIGKEGKTQDIRLLKSSKFKILDDAAVSAVALWRAHKQYVGRKVVLPVSFVLARRR
jgi:TonB family protein